MVLKILQVSTGDGWAHYIARPLVGNIFPNLVSGPPPTNGTDLTSSSDDGSIASWAHPTINRPVRRCSHTCASSVMHTRQQSLEERAHCINQGDRAARTFRTATRTRTLAVCSQPLYVACMHRE